MGAIPAWVPVVGTGPRLTQGCVGRGRPGSCQRGPQRPSGSPSSSHGGSSPPRHKRHASGPGPPATTAPAPPWCGRKSRAPSHRPGSHQRRCWHCCWHPAPRTGWLGGPGPRSGLWGRDRQGWGCRVPKTPPCRRRRSPLTPRQHGTALLHHLHLAEAQSLLPARHGDGDVAPAQAPAADGAGGAGAGVCDAAAAARMRTGEPVSQRHRDH